MIGRNQDLTDVSRLNAIAEKSHYNGIRVDVLSKDEFHSMIVKNGLNEAIVSSIPKTIFVSIMDSGNKPFLRNNSNYLNLEFDDVKDDIPGEAKTLSAKQAREFNKFLRLNKGARRCFIHCSAGVSRSGSLGQYIVDQLKGDTDYFKSQNQYIDVKRHFIKRLEENQKKIDKGFGL